MDIYWFDLLFVVGAEILKFLLVFWLKRRHQMDILKLNDLYDFEKIKDLLEKTYWSVVAVNDSWHLAPLLIINIKLF